MKGGKKMLDSIWQLLANYGLDVSEIADGVYFARILIGDKYTLKKVVVKH